MHFLTWGKYFGPRYQNKCWLCQGVNFVKVKSSFFKLLQQSLNFSAGTFDRLTPWRSNSSKLSKKLKLLKKVLVHPSENWSLEKLNFLTFLNFITWKNFSISPCLNLIFLMWALHQSFGVEDMLYINVDTCETLQRS